MSKIDLKLYGHNIWGGIAPTECIGNRNAALQALILAHDPDLCCFQECNPRTSRAGADPIEGLLAELYEEVPTEAGKKNHTPIFYRRERFDLLESGYLIYDRELDPSKSLTWAVLAEKESGIRFGICSTHFWYRADSELDDQRRMESAATLLSKMEELRDRYDMPVFAAGDLNCGRLAPQGEAPCRWLAERLLDIRQHSPFTTDALTTHAYPRQDAHHLYHAPFGTIANIQDHLFACPHPKLALHSFEVDNSAVSFAASDHSPLIAQVSIRK